MTQSNNPGLLEYCTEDLNLSIRCCIAVPKCLLKIGGPEFTSLWNSSARPLAYCNKHLIDQISLKFDSKTCLPVSQEFLDPAISSTTCQLPDIPYHFPAACNFARKLVALSWITAISSCILLLLWLLLIVQICRGPS